MNRFFVALFVLTACADDTKFGPPPVAGRTETGTTTSASGSTTDTGSSSSTDETGTLCDAFVGCVETCQTQGCLDACASVTEVNVEECWEQHCAQLIDDCADGDTDEDACAKIPDCSGYLDPATSTGTSTGSSGGTSETGSSTSDTGSSSSGSSSGSDSSGSSDSGSSFSGSGSESSSGTTT